MSLPAVIFLYGPPGSGKTTIGRLLADSLELPFYDLDAEIEAASGLTIPQIFDAEGESGFRQREAAALQAVLGNLGGVDAEGGEEAESGVIALGGGALTVPAVRQLVESRGQVLLLTASFDTLLGRLNATLSAQPEPYRPLLAGNLPARLSGLLDRRAEHYASFSLRLDSGVFTAPEAAWQCQVQLGMYRVKAMGQAYDVRVVAGGLRVLGQALRARGLRGPLALVTDEHVATLYAQAAAASLQAAGFQVQTLTIPAGEAHKNPATLQRLWEGFLAAGVERGSTVIALGGGVVGDLAGFAAATFLRGVRWVNLPTTLLSMVDASLGGKTGADLPKGKNLIGAFHPPALVLADPQLLASLPPDELRSGMAEVVKHGVIADPDLFAQVGQFPPQNLAELVRRAIAVKIQIIEADPYERGRRAALNLGHTVGHAVEHVSNYAIRHGEAVAIGMVAEARLAEHLGMAEAGLSETIGETLARLGLPTAIPAGMERRLIIQAMGVDKKKAGGRLRFALPLRIGEVVTGVEVSDFSWLEAL